MSVAYLIKQTGRNGESMIVDALSDRDKAYKLAKWFNSETDMGEEIVIQSIAVALRSVFSVVTVDVDQR